jgi:hypothetical protein
MNSARQRSQGKKKKISDLAVDGFIAGILSGMAMGVVLFLGEWILGGMAGEFLNLFSPFANYPLVSGGLVHLAVSSIYGLVFGLVVFLVYKILRGRLPLAVLGLVYGLVLFFLAQTAFVTGIGSALQAIPGWLFLLAHLMYGGLLGFLMGRKD